MLKKFIKQNKSYELEKWLKSNQKFLKKKELKEVYFPRLVYSFFRG